ncbi:btb/poz domain-containing protein 19-like [Gigaspora margarita]|uniref:Btb/poz domain-containing protein 19-like n=1 Tax=Gigaspora margarita TaxID=4874 RepID=A0A8H3X081_GIGMA|nr:btb/poz domain-containing protein 19-like [Gigaspora margarita]
MLNQYFINNIEKLISNDLKLILDFIESFKELQKIVVRTIFHKPKLFFSAENFQTIPIQYLKLFISNENLDIKETEILEKVILWLNGRDLKDLNEYYNILLKYIRFNQITDNGFKTLYVNLKESINPAILKKIIRKEQLIKLMQWIDRQDTTNYRHNFKLLLKKNIIKAEQLHNSCNNKGATIVIGKLKNEDSFIKGYNPLNWTTETYKGTKDSFIFTSSSKNKNMRLGRVKSNYDFTAISCRPEGTHFGYYDLYILYKNNNWKVKNDGNYYESIGLEAKDYLIDYFEVFQIIKYR